ncbi:MAG: dehydratase [Alphaproteobacteria bacterium]|nr:dehydratase [Alphaproteobacteria bacterium]
MTQEIKRTEDGFTYMEDLAVGQKISSGPLTVTAEEIIAFGRRYDPQDFHIDAEAAKHTVFGELIASGWQTAALTMRMIFDAAPRMKGGIIGRGIEKLEWPRAVKPGDTLSYEGEITALRPSASKPQTGVMRLRNTTRNQHGEVVLEMETVIFVPRRGEK